MDIVTLTDIAMNNQITTRVFISLGHNSKALEAWGHKQLKLPPEATSARLSTIPKPT